MATIYDFSAKTLGGNEKSLAEYRGHVLLIVNTASQCGFTPQYEGLEELHLKFHSQGFSVLGFPCNQFGAQEPGDESEIMRFCSHVYGVSFPVFAKVEVNGKHAHPLFLYLQSAKAGVLGTESIKWNFTKFLISRDGDVVARFGSATKPKGLEGPISHLLSSTTALKSEIRD
jgi:glutathione peroxidase